MSPQRASHRVNGPLYYVAGELYKLDAIGNVSLVADIAGGPASSITSGSTQPKPYGGFTQFNGNLFHGARGANGFELRKVDAAGSVSLAADIYSGSGSSNSGQFGGFTE